MPEIGDTLSSRYLWIMVTGSFGAFGFGYGEFDRIVAETRSAAE